MATPAEIDEQIKLERTAISRGRRRFKKMTAKLEGQAYASATVYGSSLVNSITPLMAAKIEECRVMYRAGHNGRYFKDLADHLDDIEPEALATITIKVLIDQLFLRATITDRPPNTLANVTINIGIAVMLEVQMRHYEKAAPGLFDYVKKKYWHKACGTWQKPKVAQLVMNRCNVPWDRWPQALRVRLGAWLLDKLMETCDIIQIKCIREGKKTINIIEPTEELLKMKEQIIQMALDCSAFKWPTLIEPNDWSSSGGGGGYLLNELNRAHKLVRVKSRLKINESSGGEEPANTEGTEAFVNRLQKVAYKVSPFILEVAQMLAASGIGVGKFQPVITVPLPSKPADIAENYESRHSYRRAAAEAMNFNAAAFRKSVRTRAVLEVASEFVNRDRFFLPWSYDYRGRAYPIPSFLHPHDTDFGKSLIRFADESTITTEAIEWLAFQVGTTYGLDKKPIAERKSWAHNNTQLLLAVSEDPLGTREIWEAADEPWQFLAAAEEYVACVLKKTRTTTGLPVAIDATCSGLQVLAGLAKDAKAAALVNVLPGDRPSDAYAVVAATAAPNVPDGIRPHLDRKVVKRVVMTIPYNAKPHSNRNYIREALIEKGIDFTPEELTQTAKAVRAAMDQVLPGPMAVMTWIEKVVMERMALGDRMLEWVSPSGFEVQQILDVQSTREIALHLMGRVRVSLNEPKDQPDRRRHRNSTSPNLIHSLDAALLHLGFRDFSLPFSVIHDSIWGRATDMDLISSRIRETYAIVFKQDILQDWADQVQASTKPPIIGDLNVNDVVNSTYFFS